MSAEQNQTKLSCNFKIRVFGQGLNTSQSHGYCVDDFPAGISTPIGEIPVENIQATNLRSLRQRIQYNTSGHMDRRSLIFQEALFIMKRLPNLYNRPKLELTQYQFGFCERTSHEVKMIHPSRELEPIANLLKIADLYLHDLVIVPLSQLPPELDPINDGENAMDIKS